MRQELAGLILANEKEWVFWTHRADTLEGHEEVIPQHIDLVRWQGQPEAAPPFKGAGWEPDDQCNLTIHFDGVPLDHTHFTIRHKKQPILTAELYGTGHRRFWRLTVTSVTSRAEFVEKGGVHPEPGAHYG